ncbi:LIM and calponin homology domains-containing 1 isoform X4 [Pelobates cultripes]|uniref:LIM and calponin homology domains-containing 1 isoform X4 n=1 Tax=Pelobates cultripes TaxID=61616 RepID=A0AAD1SHS5_PELCU|nr:LIM and calponin homology domains-containing 1 isoform X4 [Pelobates cultripes]
MASPALVLGELPQPQETPPDPACKEAQKWIEQVTGRSFGGKDFRTGLENGILLCELLNAIKPGLVKKINRLPTPIAGLDNITLFLRGCKELGLKESQLFDPGDLQDTSNRTTVRVSDCNRKLRNVLVTVYWLGKAANCCISYSGNHLDLKEFEGLLAQMRKENEEIESPKRSIRDSGYIDCWDSERSDSLSPPRHGRDDSFDSLDSFGSRSQQTPSPDVVLRGSSDGRGSDSESDLPHRRLPDVRKDDMSARRVSFGENKAFVPFNQYLPNKSNQTAYMPAPLRKKKTEREDCRKSWSTATSPLGGERPFSQNHSGTIEEEENDLHDVDIEAKVVSSLEQLPSNPSHVKVHSAKREDGEDLLATACGPKVIEEVEKLKSLEQAGIKVMPASIRYSSSIPTDPIMPNVTSEAPTLRFESPTMPHQPDAHTDYRDEHVSQPQACDPDQSHSVVNPFCSDLSSQPQATGETYDQEILRFSPRSALSDESMSMYDMRYEEEGSMLPHSRAHQEHLQTVNDLLKEEDETWQDDLAKWKTRRRSASQDLIKREQERKKMERLLSGDSDSSERRKSIKTYKEIVEEKERRERELHEAYKNARTKEEAEKILQKYIERFTISEAVLERLVMPKILERSHSVEPGLVTSSEDPNPLKYLRQQSLPSPKYTATVEAVISSPSSESECKVLPSVTSPNKNVISKTVPMLTAKPYSQPKNTQHVLKTFKVDGKASLNGETCNGMDQKDRGCGNLVFAHSLTRSQLFEGKARVDEVTKEKKPDVACLELSVTRCDIQNSVKELHGFTGTENHVSLGDELASNVKTEDHSVQHYTKGNDHSVSLTQVGSSISSIELTPCIPLKESAVNGKVLEEERKVETKTMITNWAQASDSKEQKEMLFLPMKDANGETECNKISPAVTPSLTSPSRFCSWDPEEERKRQERWQHEQERLLQERYQKEQEKLKEEWEKAQKEVEEEERKYYEEERKIIEDTVMPLTVSPVADVNVSMSERNGNVGVPEDNHEKEDMKAGTLWTESQGCLIESIQTKNDKPQTLWEQEGAFLGAEEEYAKGTKQRQEMVENESEMRNHHNSVNESNTPTKCILQPGLQEDQHVASPENHLPVVTDSPNNFLDGRSSPMITRGTDGQENMRGVGYPSQSSASQCQSPNRSVSGKKLCSTCGLPLGKGAAMIIEKLSLYFHIQCFKCGICKGQLGDATTGTDVRIRNGLLNCNDCYVRSRTAGHPTPL